MKLIKLSFCIILLSASVAFGQSKKELRAEVEQLNAEITELKKPTEVNFEDKNEKASYALGMVIASNIQTQGLDSLNLEALKLAFEDVLKNQEPKLEQEEAGEVVQGYVQEASERKIGKIKEEGAKFFADNKTKEGIKETESGLQYKIIKEGTGKTPVATDKVTVHYVGKLLDGTVFDSSIERGEPATFGVNQVIPGWTEALQLMKEGAKWELYIPSDLAYGDRGAGGQIPPYSTLVFEVELLKINE